MPSNGSPANPSGTLTNQTSTAASKKGKVRSSTRKASGSASARAAAGRTAESAEIIFKDQPNPYHPTQPPFIWIDHPQERERLLGPVYVVRLGVGGAEKVEISVDGRPWQACRLTSGYWWFDWSGIQPGKHTLSARMRTADGRCFRTPARSCEYRP